VNGLCDEIMLFEGMILDGRNRCRAYIELGVEQPFVQFTGTGPLCL
jgi:hypothetical protein